MALTAEQKAAVKATVPVIKEHGQTITSVFYERMLAAHPELKNYFSLRIQHSGRQQAALANAVLAYAANIDNLEALGGAVEHIANKHASHFVRPEHYPIVGKFLVAAFAEVLGDALTSDVADAWIAAYGQLADIFIQREKELQQEASGWSDWRSFTIARKVKEADNVYSLYLEPKDGEPLKSYLPGQYVSVRIPIRELDGLYQCRQFSLSMAPGDGMRHYRVSVKRDASVDDASAEDVVAGRVPGLVSHKLHREFQEGSQVELSPPRGDFTFDAAAVDPDAPVVLLSIGVGATPLMSMLESIVGSTSQAPRPVRWVHAARHTGTLCFADAVRDFKTRHPDIRSLTFVKSPNKEVDRQGRDYDVESRMDLPRAEAEGMLLLQDKRTGYYICGPEQWMSQAKQWFIGRGVESERIFYEVFGSGEAS